LQPDVTGSLNLSKEIAAEEIEAIESSWSHWLKITVDGPIRAGFRDLGFSGGAGEMTAVHGFSDKRPQGARRMGKCYGRLKYGKRTPQRKREKKKKQR